MRKPSQLIRIGDDIKIMVVKLKGDKAYIGIDAPDEVEVHREEVYQAIKRGEARDGKATCGSMNPDAHAALEAYVQSAMEAYETSYTASAESMCRAAWVAGVKWAAEYLGSKMANNHEGGGE
jgi:carbon storage regulator